MKATVSYMLRSRLTCPHSETQPQIRTTAAVNTAQPARLRKLLPVSHSACAREGAAGSIFMLFLGCTVSIQSPDSFILIVSEFLVLVVFILEGITDTKA